MKAGVAVSEPAGIFECDMPCSPSTIIIMFEAQKIQSRPVKFEVYDKSITAVYF